jgi:fused signal recognition particle receptor
MQFPLWLATAAPTDSELGPYIGLGVVIVIAVVAWLLLRSKPVVQPPSEVARTTPAPAVTTGPTIERGQRRTQDGVTRLGPGGKAEKVSADELRAEEAELARLAAEEALRRATGYQAEQRAALQTGLHKTRSEGFIAKLSKLFAGKQLDADLLGEVEEVLYRADLGVKTADSLLSALKEASSRKELGDPDHVWRTLKAKSTELLDRVGQTPVRTSANPGPAVLMVVGVNGSGKTTSIGKLAHRYAGEGHKVLVAAGDTFRAAAVDQLEVWCERAGVPIHRGKDNADPASVAYAAVERAKAEGFDLVIVDTAGRLHTNQNLMAELQKVARVCGKAHDGAPHEVLLVLDATMGQNAVKQAEQFRDAVPVTGIVLTKLDGTAKGGVVLAIAEQLKLPVKLVGVGERMQDLRDFDAKLFVAELFATE